MAPEWSFDPDKREANFGGYRSYVLKGEPAITEADVVDAQARGPSENELIPSVYVAIELSPGGANRLEDLTREAIKRRIAIVVNGVVESAPVVQEAIAAGT